MLPKTFPDGSKRMLHMVFLVYRCTPGDGALRLNEEFTEHRWARASDLEKLDLNPLTRETLASAGYL